ncbi:MAG TPA: nickel-type superoxide dismutase maturation protease [Candidatus Limnocylindria bacterium]|nr:nickel-type superoxide dismutase maturation protease [Candidatus Limnocylindria bacterium]
MHPQRGPLRPLFFVFGLAVGLTAVARRWTDVVAVRGSSMAPALEPGDLLLVERWTYRRRAPRPGEVVLAPDPRQPSRELIKRVAAVRGDALDVRGDAAASSDSRTFGALPLGAVEWRAALRYWPPSRCGWIPAPPPTVPLELEPQGGEPACSAFGDLVVGLEE